MFWKSSIFGLFLVLSLATAAFISAEKLSRNDDLPTDEAIKSIFGIGDIGKVKGKLNDAGHKMLRGTRNVVDKMITEEKKFVDKLWSNENKHLGHQDDRLEGHGQESHGPNDQGNYEFTPQLIDDCDPISGMNCIDIRFGEE